MLKLTPQNPSTINDLTPVLQRSLVVARMHRLAFRLVALEKSVQAGLGPRVMRFRARLIEEERQKLAEMAKEAGFQLE